MSFYTSIFRLIGRPFRRAIGPVLRPVTRLVMGAIAIPMFRFILTKIFRLKEIDDELEKDLEQWFRGSMLLLAATANMEHLFFFWMGFEDAATGAELRHHWFSTCLRLLLAIGVVEAMPDQELFAVIHPGPPRLRPHRGILREVWKKRKLIIKGVVCQHLNRLSPVMAIMCAIFGGPYENDPEAWTVGWACYALAIFQYLIIGLVTSRDKALDVLTEFDRAVAKRRRDLIKEFDIKEPTPEPKKVGWWGRRRWKRWRRRILGNEANQLAETAVGEKVIPVPLSPSSAAEAAESTSDSSTIESPTSDSTTEHSTESDSAASGNADPSPVSLPKQAPETDSDDSVVGDGTSPDN